MAATPPDAVVVPERERPQAGPRVRVAPLIAALGVAGALVCGTASAQSGAADGAAADSCEQFRARLAARIEAQGVRGYLLEILPSSAPLPSGAKVVGNCQGGARRIVYRRWAPSAAAGAQPAAPTAAVRPTPAPPTPAPPALSARAEPSADQTVIAAAAPAAVPTRAAATPAAPAAPATRAAPAAAIAPPGAVTPDKRPGADGGREAAASPGATSRPSAAAAASLAVASAARAEPAPALARDATPAPALRDASAAPAAAPRAAESRVGLDGYHPWLALAALLVAGGAWWLWRARFSRYDAAGLPRAPRIRV